MKIARRANAGRFAFNEMCHNAHVCTMATQTQILVPDIEAIRAAHRRISPRIHRTPVLTSTSLNEIAGASLYFKCENLQKTGSFKIRGATNAVFSLTDQEARSGVVAPSSGNHAAALSLAARWRGIPAFIIMPSNPPQKSALSKATAAKSLNASLRSRRAKRPRPAS